MDIFGNDPQADVFGKSPSTAWGTAFDADGWGNRPADVWGNLSSETSDSAGDVAETFLDILGGLFGG